jgi:hypothetical protein
VGRLDKPAVSDYREMASRFLCLMGAYLEKMYQPELWHEVFAVLGSASAALAGLLIVGASVRADEVMGTPYWRLRARNSTLGLIVITLGAVLVLVPQDTSALGIELTLLNIVAACLLPGAAILQAIKHRSGQPLGVLLMAVSLYALAAAGGLSLTIQAGGGLYLTMFAYFGLMLTVVALAFGLLIPHSDKV